MPKVSERFDPNTYAPVADRLTLFWSAHPNGRIETRLAERSDIEVVFEARVYRDAAETKPAATGWAAERVGDGEVNTVACLENTETSAIGRALANLGFTASRQRPSAEEMAKAERARARMANRPRAAVDSSLQRRADVVMDLLRTIETAREAGLRAARAERWREQLLAGRFDTRRVHAWEVRLREWIRRAAPPRAWPRVVQG